MRIDAHQHFWYYNPAEHAWMNDEMELLKRDYLPEDLLPLLQANGFDGAISVQASQNLQESERLLKFSDRYDFIKGVVGWVDLRSTAVHAQLEKFAVHPKFKGVRHVVHDEPDDEFMLLEDFQRGLGALKDFGLTYDLLLFYKHLPVALKLLEKFPEQAFVVDHISKPVIKDKMISPWKEGIEELAKYDNVSCKLSGMVTETTWRQWSADDFKPYLDIVLESFGPDRVMIGSDWPVCTLSGSYQAVMDIVKAYIAQFSVEVQEKILGGNCARFYGIS